MDKKVLVKKIKAVIRELKLKRIRPSLVMLISTDPYVNKFVLLLSSPNLDEKDPETAYNLVARILFRKLSRDGIKHISNIKIVNSSDPFVRQVRSAFRVRGSDVYIRNTYISRIYIDEAILILS